jgi:hypothetical protein
LEHLVIVGLERRDDLEDQRDLLRARSLKGLQNSLRADPAERVRLPG